VCIRDAAGQIVRWVGINLDISAYKQSQETAKRRQDSLELLHEVGNKLVAEHDLEKLVQLVTDTGREASGAAFGAFFYNVLNERGESYMLYTLSGVSRSAFDKFPMPRATAMFGPTFRGEGVIRVDDVRADPRYGHSSPHHGMPAGHLPVRSYLAVPVTSRTGEVLGGLFFGHPAVGMFTAEAETVVVALAAQAAIAIDNAKLYAALQKELEEQRRSEARLRDSETRWRQLAEAMPHLVWTCGPDGKCDYLSPQWLTYTGLPEQEQLGEGWLQFVHPDEQATLISKWNANTAVGGIFDTEFRIRRADGKYRWFKTRAVPVRDTGGRIIKWYGTNTDIEDVRRIEQAVRKSEHQLRLITDHAPVFLAQCDAGHRFKFVNRPYAERYSLTREDIIGRHVSEITGAAAYATFKIHMVDCLAGKRVEFEQEIPYHTLGKRWVHVIYEPERGSDGEVNGLVAVIVDITTRKQAEFELAKARDEALAASAPRTISSPRSRMSCGPRSARCCSSRATRSTTRPSPAKSARVSR
jgi:PAS domain S-box-containing protein